MSATGRGAPAQSATADREIVISRVISAPRELVFEAFTEVRHLSRWWGPEGFTTTTRAFEFRVGGEWDFVMHGPDGTDYQEWISWTEIAPPERIALLHGEYRGDGEARQGRCGDPRRGVAEGRLMARSRKTPADELAEVDERIAALVKEDEGLSAQRGDAEALFESFESRRSDAMLLRRLGEEVEVPDEAEQARLQRVVSQAKDEQGVILRERRQREEERLKIIAAGLPHFDTEAEESARAYEALGQALLAALADFQAGGQAKGAGWGRLREGRKELGLDQMPGVGYHDLGHLRGEIAEAIRTAWPANSEERWRELKAREQAPPGARLGNAEALAKFSSAAA
jgi:uncharacterized protein YndB with AHSA1/START domain